MDSTIDINFCTDQKSDSTSNRRVNCCDNYGAKDCPGICWYAKHMERVISQSAKSLRLESEVG